MPNPTWLEEAIAKYRRELDHVKLRPQLRELLAQIHAKGGMAQNVNTRLVSKVKQILDANGVDTDIRVGYHAYSYALDKSQRTMEFMVDRIREHQILRARWEGRGLDASILDKLDSVLIFNMTQP